MRLVLADRIHTFAGADDVPSRAPGTVSAGGAGEPAALLVRDGRVARVGRRSDVEPAAAGARRLDLRGTTLTPGLTDAHLHLVEWAHARREVDLTGAPSPERAARRAAEHAGRAGERGGRTASGRASRTVGGGSAAGGRGEWLRGQGWDPHRWDAFPTRDVLDRHVPDRPVALTSHDMHALWVNGEALRRAGVDASTPEPDGGRIVRDAAGEPTGVLLEDAIRLVTDRIPRPAAEESIAAVLDAQAELHRLGITGVHSVEMPAETFRSLDVLERLHTDGRLQLRVLQHLPVERLDAARALGLRSGFGDDRLRIGAVKIFLDGALGSRTAWLRAPYEGEPTDAGIRLLEPGAFEDRVRAAAAAGLAVAVHAIGDAAVSLALDVLGDSAHRVAALPHRIEHVQLCPPDRFGDAARAGIACSMQPAHLITDWRAAERHWGRERCRGAYAFRSLLYGRRTDAPAAAAAPVADAQTRGVVAFGSDAPVEPVDPRRGLFAAVARQDLAGEPAGGWFPEERLHPAEAFLGYTVGAARAAGAADRVGRLAPGCLADFVAWNRDPLALADAAELLELRCVATVVGGEPQALR